MKTEATDKRDQFARQDEAAVAAVQRGDAERYRELVERHERRVYAIAWSRLGDAALAEDVVQEAFIRAYRRLWLLGDGAKFAAWINTIVRRVAINFGLRHRRELDKRERWALEQAPRAGEVSAVEAELPCTPETLRQTLAKLPDAHRECLVLFYLEGRSGADAASALGISESALRVRLHRARAALRERLEERLAESLEQLKPGKSFVPAIMTSVLATSSAKAATAGGGGAAVLGALVKLSPFNWLLSFSAVIVGMLPSMALNALAARAEARNLRDPEGFRAQMSRKMHRLILWVVPLMVVPLVLGFMALNLKLGEHPTHVIMAVFMVVVLVFFWFTQHNRFQSGMLIWYLIQTVGMVLLAAGVVSALDISYFFIAATLWLMWTLRRQPARMDNSLFFRALQGMLEVPPDAPAPGPATRLEESDLKRFGRFLGDRWLVNDYRWRPDGLLLRQRFVNPFQPNKPSWLRIFRRESSNILLAWNGEVTAQISEADTRAGRVLHPAEATLRAQQESLVATAVKCAWREFRNGNTAAAERALGEKSDAEIFVVPPARAASMRWRQVSLGLVVVLFTVMLVLAKNPGLVKAIAKWWSRGG
jgi:RNA polymerase sigma factor (sigma-70 family)